MVTCDFRPSCAFVEDLKQRRPVTLDSVKSRFCDSNYYSCARFMVAMVHGPTKVSRYLFPEDVDEAFEIIEEGG